MLGFDEHAYHFFQSTGTVDAYELPFGDFLNTVYTVVPPHSDGGLQNVPAAQVIGFLSGIANISLPISDDYAAVHGDRECIILAPDTTANRHYTVFGSDIETVALQAPVRNSIVPAHDVVHEGPYSIYVSSVIELRHS